MDLALIVRLLGIVLLLLANGFFVAIEFAVIAARRSRVEHLGAQGNRSAELVGRWLNSPAARDRLVAAAQVGITVASLALGALGESTFSAIIEPPLERLAEGAPDNGPIHSAALFLPPLLSVLLFTILHVVYGEQVPKVMVLGDAERWAVRLARPMHFFTRVASPFVTALDALAGLSLRALGLGRAGDAHRSIHTIDELKELVNESEEGGLLEEHERAMLHAVFDFGDMRARQVMVPRTEMVTLSCDAPLAQLVQLAVETSLSKFPVYDEAPDNIIGLVHVKDLVRALAQDPRPTLHARDLMREPLFIPDSTTVNDLLRNFRARRLHTAIVLDEYGGTAGLVTLEDLLAEIVGEVGDVFRPDAPEIVRLDDGRARISGLTQIEVVNEAFGLKLHDSHYDTIAGYVLGRLGRLAVLHDEVEADGVRLCVDALDGRRIAYLLLIPPGYSPPAEGNGAIPTATGHPGDYPPV